ncbi:hypothetical protein DHEL01_v200041 [Diaporthe helianthi]|uniref:SsuA/THI5-like domain-containing protein n=1 Tax=Diaporthe helianthi TaxID=158607 RepID=A0A2P5IGH7_DIAHE|nr:hypothetical protein DHEL01_v200041 [Diaporthe helianthi]
MRLSATPVLVLATSVAALQNVQYGAFLPTATYSVANQLGFFTANGLNVTFNQVASSTDAFNSILSGQYDILTATVDNALNYRFNQNQKVTVLGQLDQGPDLVIASVPSITCLTQLRGKSIIVDSPLSGYSFLLQYVLAKAGLTLAKGDYTFTTVGGTSTRYANLLNGTLPDGSPVYATILTYPLTVQSQSLPAGQAPNILARVSDYIAPVTSSAFTIRESSLSDRAKSALLTRFIASMFAANRFLANPANARCSVKAIANQLGVGLDVARKEYASVTNRVSGEVSPGGDFTFNKQGLLNDVMVRSTFGGFSSLPAAFDFAQALWPGKGKLIDYSIRDAAVDAHPFCKHPDKRYPEGDNWTNHIKFEPCEATNRANRHQGRWDERNVCPQPAWVADIDGDSEQLDPFCPSCDNTYGPNNERMWAASLVCADFTTKLDQWEYAGGLDGATVQRIQADMDAALERHRLAAEQGPYNNSYWVLVEELQRYSARWDAFVAAKKRAEEQAAEDKRTEDAWELARVGNRVGEAVETSLYPAG